MTVLSEFQFEQFYFGNLIVDQDRTSATTGVVARTPNVTPAHATECVKLAKLRPPMPSAISDEMPSALGLFRGSSTSADFILAKAQCNRAGTPQVLFLLVPVSELRKLGGNVLVWHALGMAEMPTYTRVDKALEPFTLRDAGPPDVEMQTEALMDLLLYCQDSFSTIEGILAAVVQGWPLAIINSPAVLRKRLQFLQGLLSLLPTPARTGITFATHVSDFKTGQAQVKFASHHEIPDKHVVFDWAQGKLLTPAPQDPYSHYILAQLRLDPTLAIQETERLARTAIWRATHRENLGTALEWVSRRAALDQTVRDGQPADRDLVSAVLREDPTLPDDLRRSYIRHVLAFALALNEPESVDVVAAQCALYPELKDSVTGQLQAALEDGHALVVYKLLERWILRVPEGSADQWRSLLHIAAKTHLASLLEAGHDDRAQHFLAYLRRTPPELRVRDVMGQIVLVANEAAQLTPELARQIFLLAAEFAGAGDLQNLLTNAAFLQQLPESLRVVVEYLNADPDDTPVPAKILHEGARAFGDGYRMLVLTRLVELAVVQERSDLIDTPALQALLVMTQSPRSEQFHALIQHVIDDFTMLDNLRKLAPPGPRILIQLMLQTHDYDHAVAMLEYYQNTVFGTDNLDEFNIVIAELFSIVALPPEELITALQQFENSQIRPKVRAVMYASALANREWATEMDYAAKHLTTTIFNDYTIISDIGHENALRLLEYHAQLHNAIDTMRVAAALIDHAVFTDMDDASLVVRMWPVITWDEETTGTAIELLRRFVRGIPMRKVPSLISYLGDELGAEIGEILQATYIMRFIVDDADLLQFADVVHTAAGLLADVTTTYHSNKELPTLKRLRRDLDTMTGGLSDDERHEVADNFLTIPSQVYELGNKRARQWNKPADLMPFVQAKAAPQNSIELLYFIGGHFADREKFPLTLEREEMAHLFGTRSAAMLLRETNAITHLLQGLQRASTQLEKTPPSPTALLAELNSLWDALSLYHKRQIQDQLAQSCQQLAGAIEVMASHANDRLFGNTNLTRQLETGKRQPQTALEALRWIHGYFAHKHTR